jgi:hypothetical protein
MAHIHIYYLPTGVTFGWLASEKTRNTIKIRKFKHSLAIPFKYTYSNCIHLGFYQLLVVALSDIRITLLDPDLDLEQLTRQGKARRNSQLFPAGS